MPNDFKERVGDMEMSFGAEPLDNLLAELDATEKEWSDGGALFGAGGFSNDIRKKILSVTLLRIRDEMLSNGEKAPTEKIIDALAHADKQYGEWLDRQVIARANWLALDAKRQAVFLKVNRGQSLLRVGAMRAP